MISYTITDKLTRFQSLLQLERNLGGEGAHKIYMEYIRAILDDDHQLIQSAIIKLKEFEVFYKLHEGI